MSPLLTRLVSTFTITAIVCGNKEELYQCLLSLSILPLTFIPLSSSAVTVGFDQTVQTVDEGQSAMVTVSLKGESVTLDRDVFVTVMTVDGTANGTDGMM